MREILFRGKTRDNEWVQGSLHIEYGENTKDGDKTTDYRILGMRGECQYVIPETVGQYIGLTDKNGKKIFEGDIVKKSWIYHYYVGNERREKINTFIGQVVLYKGRYKMKEQGEIIGISHDGEWIEVIGNIHDNPELLRSEYNA